MLRYIVPAAVFAVLIGFFYFGLSRDKEALPSPLIGRPAPIFDLPRVEDPAQRISNRDFAGRMYVLNVWATWCVGCRQEHEALVAIAQRNEVPIIGLNWRDDLAQAQRWLSVLGNPYVASGFDAEGRVAIDWGVYGAPETFLVGPDGRVLFKHVAPLDLTIWERDFLPRIRKQEGSR